MKKILLLIIGLLLPIITFAAPNPNDYTSMNLIEAITGEDNLFNGTTGYTSIDLSIDKVNDSDDQVTVYAFIGFGCPHCHDLLTFLNEIAPEYDSKFQLKAFELWRTDDATNNGQLAKAVQDFVGTDVIEGDIENGNGVPVIIIGETVLQGYGDDYADTIKNAIDTEYAKDIKDRYDIFEEMRKAEEEALKEEKSKNVEIIIWNGVIVAVAAIIIIAIVNYQNNKIHDRIDAIYEKLGIPIENENDKENIVRIQKEVDEDDEDAIKDDDEYKDANDYELKETAKAIKKKTNKSKSKK